LEVKGKDSNAKTDPNSTITASCVATTFVLLEKPAPAAAAAKGAKTAAPAAKGI
jgi:hypothetical protein